MNHTCSPFSTASVLGLAALAALSLCWRSSALADESGEPTPKPGQRVDVSGRAFYVESVDGDRLVLTAPQPPTQTLGAFITPVAARASSAQSGAGRTPRKLIDGSGWEETYPGSGVYVHTNSVYADGGCMWNGSVEGAWLEFDLGSVHSLNGFYVWNYNEEGDWITRRVRDIEVSVSLDGAAWVPVGAYALALARGSGPDPGQAVRFDAEVPARYVRWDIRSNHRDGEDAGLAEVRFADADRAAEPPSPPDYSPRYDRPAHPMSGPGGASDQSLRQVFPAGAGVVDVTQPPYGARGDGVTDDTAAIQRALDDHPNMGAIIYFPSGVYRVSDTLRWPEGGGNGAEQKRTVLWGESRSGTVLQLRDRCPGYEDPRHRRGVIWTGEAPAQRFGNEIHNLTVDTGVGNPGACGIQFIANNQGGVYDVTIVSGDGHGVAGLDMGYTDEQGPCLIKNVRVVGFEIGVYLAYGVASEVLEHITVENQSEAGIRNDGQPCTIRDLRSSNEVVALKATAGFTVLVEGELLATGHAPSRAAIESDATLVVRDVRTGGYASALEHHGPAGSHVEPGPDIDLFLSDPALSLFGETPEPLRLPVRETPEAPWDDPATWVSCQAFGAVPGDGLDDAPSIQAAIDSGGPTVYLPRGDYEIGQSVVVRGAVRRLVGCRAWLRPIEPLANRDAPLLRFEDGDEATVVVEGLATDFASGPFVFLEHAASRTLVMRQLMINFQGARAYRNTGSGDLFIEDVVGRWFAFRGQNVWARQLNPEGDGTHIANARGTLWVLGLKTEGGGTLVETTDGGATEILGGLSYTVGPGKLAPMVVSTDSDVAMSFCEACFTGDPFATVVRESRGPATLELPNGDARWQGHFTLYRARSGR